MKNIGVIFGGKSSEHDISIISACSLMQNLDEKKFNIYPLYVTKKGEILLNKEFSNIKTFQTNKKLLGEKVCFLCGANNIYVQKGKKFKKYTNLDFCFVVMHGVNGEDGNFSAILNMSNIPYSCADILASSVAMDKVATKYFCKGVNIPVLNFVSIKKQDFLNNYKSTLLSIKKIGFPCIIKPAKLGSSIGISKCENPKELINALNLAFVFDLEVLIEPYLEDFKEYNIALLKIDNEVVFSQIEQPLKNDEILSFQDKYLNNSKVKGMESLDRIIPAKIDETNKKLLQKYAKKVYESLNFGGVIRIDFICFNNKIYLNEINSIPGSFANYLFDMPYKILLQNIIDEEINNFKEKQNLTYSFESSVLNLEHNSKLQK